MFYSTEYVGRGRRSGSQYKFITIILRIPENQRHTILNFNVEEKDIPIHPPSGGIQLGLASSSQKHPRKVNMPWEYIKEPLYYKMYYYFTLF